MATVRMSVSQTDELNMTADTGADVTMCVSSEVRIVNLSDYVSKTDLENSNVLRWGEMFPTVS